MQNTRRYIIERIVDQPNWKAISTLEIDCKYGEITADVKAFGQICCNEREILLHLWTEQKEIRAEEYGPLGMPCKDSCLEFFFCPEENDTRYFNVEFNLNKCLYLGIGTCIQDLSRIIIPTIENLFAPETNRTENGWEIYFKIPYHFIQRFFPDFYVYEGKVIRANCYTCAEAVTVPYDLSWNRINKTPLTFHRREDFGIMEFH